MPASDFSAAGSPSPTPPPSAAQEPSAEDVKLVTLARASRARAGSAEGAAVRDDIGRTYAAAAVSLPSLTLTALQAAVAAAVSSGSDSLDAAVVVGAAGGLSGADRAIVADLGIVTVLLATPDGSVVVRR